METDRETRLSKKSIIVYLSVHKIKCLIFNKAITSFTFFEYELMIGRLGHPHFARYLEAHIQRAFVE